MSTIATETFDHDLIALEIAHHVSDPDFSGRFRETDATGGSAGTEKVATGHEIHQNFCQMMARHVETDGKHRRRLYLLGINREQHQGTEPVICIVGKRHQRSLSTLSGIDNTYSWEAFYVS